MPTSFTDELDESGFNVKKWIEESLIRGFGMCSTLKDSGEMTREKILKALKEDVETTKYYNEKELDKAIHELERLRFFQKKQWQDELRKFNAAKFEYANKENRKRKRIRKGHTQARKILLEFFSQKDISEDTREIIKYGLEQLNLDETIDSEKRYISEEYTDIEKFKKETLEDAQWNVNYYKGRLVKGKKEKEEALKVLQQVLGDVDTFFEPAEEIETSGRNNERKLTERERLIAYQILKALTAKGLDINNIEIKNDSGDMNRTLEWIGRKKILEIAEVFKLEWLQVLKLTRNLLVELPRTQK